MPNKAVQSFTSRVHNSIKFQQQDDKAASGNNKPISRQVRMIMEEYDKDNR